MHIPFSAGRYFSFFVAPPLALAHCLWRQHCTSISIFTRLSLYFYLFKNDTTIIIYLQLYILVYYILRSRLATKLLNSVLSL